MIGVPHASNLTNSLPEQVSDPAFPRQLKRIIRNLYDQLDYARGTSSGRSEYLTSGTNGTLQVPYGGTGTTSGVSGGIPYYSATTLMASTALLKQNNLMLGGGAGTAPSTLAHPATANQYALTGTTGTSAPSWTIATSSAATGTLALRDAAGGLAMTSLTATTLTATFATFSGTVIAERLIVNGASTMAAVGMATLTATAATFSGTIHAQGATFSAVRSTTLTVTGASTLSAVSCATLTATAATFSGTVHGQAATFTAVNVSSLTVSGAATMGAVSMATLTGTSATLTGTLRVGGGLTIAGASTLAAVSMATLTGTMGQLTRLGIGAAPHATAPLYVNDMASGYGVLVGNATTFQQFGSDSSAWVAWARNAFLSGGQWTRLQSYAGAQLIQMTDGGDIRFMRQTDGATTSGTIISWGYAGQVDSAGRWGLGGAASATYTAYVYGNTWINGSLDSTDITSSNTLVVAGAASLSSTLVVGGGVTISGALNAASATLTGTARIGGGLTVAGASTQSAVGMATLTATAATFTGVVTAAAATFTGAMQLGSTLTVVGVSNFAAATFTGAINAQGATLTSLNLSTPLSVGGGGTGVTTTSANVVFAGMDGMAGAPSFRSLVAGDIPSLATSKITSGVFAAARGGTGVATFGGVHRVLYTSATDVLTSLAGNDTSTRKFLRQVDDGMMNPTAPAWDTVTKTDVGLANVENTALSTWAGSTSITTVGTITSGVWNAGAITSSGAARFNGWVTTSTGSPLAWNSAVASTYIGSTYAGAVNMESADGRIAFYTAPSGTAGNPITFTERLSIANTGAISTTGSFSAGAISGTTGTFSGAVSLGNTVNAVSPTSPNRTVTIVIGGTTYYLAAKTTND